MWDQPRFQLTVHKTRGLSAKGKHGFNDLYVVVVFGSERHKTSVQEKCLDGCWQQNCYLNLKNNESGILIVKACHRNFLLSSDEVIGQVEIYLKHFTSYETPKTSWFTLKNKKTQSKSEGEIRLSLTYHAVFPTNLSNPTMTTSIKGFSRKINIGKSMMGHKRKQESLSDLTKKGCEGEKELSELKIMPGDLKCLYWDADQESTEKDKDCDVEIRTKKSTKDKSMVNLDMKRRHSNLIFNSVLDPSHSSKEIPKITTMNISFDDKYPQQRTSMCQLTVEPLNHSKSQASLTYANEYCESKLSDDPSFKSQSKSVSETSEVDANSKDSSYFTNITLNDNENNINNNDLVNRSSNDDIDNNYTNQGIEFNVEKDCSLGDGNQIGLKDKELEFIKEVGDRMVKSEKSRNLLENHFNQFSKEELIQLILDQREWIKARELYILEIETYQKKLLLKVLDQSSKSSPMKRSVKNSFIEEINLGVNHVLQKQRLNNDENIREIKAEGKSFAKKWFGTLFKAK